MQILDAKHWGLKKAWGCYVQGAPRTDIDKATVERLVKHWDALLLRKIFKQDEYHVFTCVKESMSGRWYVADPLAGGDR